MEDKDYYGIKVPDFTYFFMATLLLFAIDFNGWFELYWFVLTPVVLWLAIILVQMIVIMGWLLMKLCFYWFLDITSIIWMPLWKKKVKKKRKEMIKKIGG